MAEAVNKMKEFHLTLEKERTAHTQSKTEIEHLKRMVKAAEEEKNKAQDRLAVSKVTEKRFCTQSLRFHTQLFRTKVKPEI